MTDDVVKKYYVYHAYGVNNELLYVGKGSGKGGSTVTVVSAQINS